MTLHKATTCYICMDYIVGMPIMPAAMAQRRPRADSGSDSHEGEGQRRTPDALFDRDMREMPPRGWPDGRMPPYGPMPGWEEAMRRGHAPAPHPYYEAYPPFDRRVEFDQYDKR